ncbi:CRE-ACL-5 protein [Aphelenchoides avenae]|nr:CRE-ACL-5 protein [Aphelenchus avenae]
MLIVFTILTYFILSVTVFVIFLSLFGLSTGIREKCAQSLIWLFEWSAREVAAEDSDDKKGDVSDEELADVGTGGLDDEAPARVDRRRRTSGDQPIIVRHWSNTIGRKLGSSRGSQHGSDSSGSDDFEEVSEPKDNTIKVIVNDSLEFITAGIETIIEDDVTNRFKAAHIASWNFLSRTQASYIHINWKLSTIWFLGLVIRYGFLFPIRLLLFCISMTLMFVCTTLIGCVPNERLRFFLNKRVMLMCWRVCARCFSAIITFHNRENRPTRGIAVANHTSPIDVMILSNDNVYALIGQSQGGILGALQRALSRSAHHIWFERSEARDRKLVAKRLKEHVDDPSKLPILIFPEGTCINNTSVMLFKKGSFEVSDTVYPIAMKYDNRLGDAFWNSHEQGYFSYMLGMMTSWALICDVWYLPPMHRKEGEDAVEFARRVKRTIAKQGGLVDLEWDGNLKRSLVPEKLKSEQKELFFQHLARTTSICSCPPDPEHLKILRSEVLPEAFDETEEHCKQDLDEEATRPSDLRRRRDAAPPENGVQA